MMNLYASWDLQHKTWGLGRLESDPIRTAAGFYYVAKYIAKGIIHNDRTKRPEGAVWDRRIGQWVEPNRLYRWSNKPVIGATGLDRWRFVTRAHLYNGNRGLPSNYINMYLLGKLTRVYIPKDQYVKWIKHLGFSFDTEEMNWKHQWPEEKQIQGIPEVIV